MDTRNFSVSKHASSDRQITNYLEIASSLVSPSTFLFTKRPRPQSYSSHSVTASQQAARTMDKAHHPSSFQQLEKVRNIAITFLFIFGFFFPLSGA